MTFFPGYSAGASGKSIRSAHCYPALVRLFLVLHFFHVHLDTNRHNSRSNLPWPMVRVILRAFFHLHVARIATTATATCHGRVVHHGSSRPLSSSYRTNHRNSHSNLPCLSGPSDSSCLLSSSCRRNRRHNNSHASRMLFRIFHRSRIVTAARHRATRFCSFLLIACVIVCAKPAADRTNPSPSARPSRISVYVFHLGVLLK